MVTRNKIKISNVGVFVVIAFAIVFFLVGFLIFSFFGQNRRDLSSFREIAETTPLPQAYMRLEPLKTALKTNEVSSFDLTINSYTAKINGTDAVILFDPQLIKITNINSDYSVLNQNFIFPRKQIAEDRIYLTAVRDNLNQETSGKFTLATINFEAISPGVAVFKLEHFPGETYGSTIIQSKDSKNILDKVEGFEVTIE